ncbi:MAG: 6-carboxytetrahydropterin synthase [Bdellovibrionales bacterium]
MSISLFYKNLTIIDYAYFDKERGVTGDSLIANVELVGMPDQEGIIFDFSKAKKAVKNIIDDICDHRFVLPEGLAQKNGESFQLEFSFGADNKSLFYSGPLEALCEIPNSSISKNNISSFLEKAILEKMPPNIDAVKIHLEEQYIPKNKAFYHYTHGLRDHFGNCQRLFHGHKNVVDVLVNGKERPDLEAWISQELVKGSIHFCFSENVTNIPNIPTGICSEHELIEIQYKSSQGQFKACLPGSMVYVMDTETTVENISLHLAKVIQNRIGSEERVELVAYEGIAKGAISRL